MSILRQHILKIFQRSYSSQSTQPIFPKQFFSAIQPTGEIHLGNYIGAIKKWVTLQNEESNVIFSIADLHSLSLPQDPKTLNHNIYLTTATLLACGIDPDKCIFFQQSAIHQHAELSWILGTLCTMARLSHLPQFKEKTESMKEIPVGIFIYPILQSADIALYKTTHVPVGKDQIQHIELANHLTRSFNNMFGNVFPKAVAIIDKDGGSIKNLKDPSKKMSKSSPPKTRISLVDPPDEILVKCKKAVTDFTSEVTYDVDNRPGVANLILIHSQLLDKSPEEICRESKNLDTGKYKLFLADVIIEVLKPIREKIEKYMASPDYLDSVLQLGAEKAFEKAEATMKEVKCCIGISRRTDSVLKMRSQAE